MVLSPFLFQISVLVDYVRVLDEACEVLTAGKRSCAWTLSCSQNGNSLQTQNTFSLMTETKPFDHMEFFCFRCTGRAS